jgi:SAM-dependent methyltransferase
MNPFEKESYDLTYSTDVRLKRHYTGIDYFVIWENIMSKLNKTDRLLDLGCGPGHLANMLYDNEFKEYTGIDFSRVAIAQAKEKAPSYVFIEANLYDIDFNDYSDFKFISVETFEHLENDIAIIKKLPKNEIFFSVPNFKSSSHYRTYDDEEFIKKYYEDVLTISNIQSFVMGRNSLAVGGISKIYVVEANIK